MIKAEWTNADTLDLQPTCNQLATGCISRQDTIEALTKENLFKHMDTVNDDGQENRIDEEFIRLAETIDEKFIRLAEAIDEEIMDSYYKIQSIFKSLPSAETEIIRCKYCKWCAEHHDIDGNVPYWICKNWDGGTDADGFCYEAERRTQ